MLVLSKTYKSFKGNRIEKMKNKQLSDVRPGKLNKRLLVLIFMNSLNVIFSVHN